MAINKLGLTRDQLASFLGDFEQIKQFEKLFNAVNEQADRAEIEDPGTAYARAQEALDAIERIKRVVELSGLGPVVQANNSIITDYADYRTLAPTPAPVIGRTFWDGGQTLNVQQTLNVAGKVNEDNFYYIKATADILKGRLVMFTGAVGASGVMTGAPASAGLGVNDGVRLMGLAAEDIPTNGFGLVQWSGTLKGFNTLGTAVGELWADGDILYYNPAFPGRMTNVLPTAPNVKAVVAAVVYASAGNAGSVVIRLTPGSVFGGTDSNVNFTSITGGDIIRYNGTSSRWENIPTLPVGSGGTGTSTAFTQGAVVFAGASGAYAQDDTQFFWDATNNRLGIGTNAPSAPLHNVNHSLLGGKLYEGMTAPITKAAAATLTAGEILNGYLEYTGGAANITFTNATNIQNALPTALQSLTDISFEWTIVNTGSGTATIVGNTGLTLKGGLTVAAATSARFRFHKTGANTFTVYRT